MIRKLIPHVCIILALFTITYVILSLFNPIIGSGFFKVILIIYSVATIICSAILYALNRRA